LIDARAALPLPAKTVRITRGPQSVELYFPPLRMPEVALPLALFGLIAMTLPAFAVAALVPSLAGATGLLSATLLASFVLPFAFFGLTFVFLAIYMLANALHVRITDDAIDTSRIVCGIVARRRHVARAEISSINAEIASRYQSLFSTAPVYQLVACEARGGKRVVVAETLRGETYMEQVKALFEVPRGIETGGS
jgi:hypothetical protein